ncbi:helix-turn-helix transcriptional regulator [Fibrella sp. HMF5335]|uniref:Helix-turn-helix transcriptional regulator n=1 Tax=Fibrella rubiginis TaxID=2817060 RepID=A0A939GJA3_9BACT|nr:AraC family transcriptional regulator [Fibrella rubiginis]MBO0938279.1 helix-turn-helix transcriptional regulator [Fibrella rubiginis]
MTNIHDFLAYLPGTCKQLVCKDILFAYYDCLQSQHRVDIYTHHSYLTFTISGGKHLHRAGKTWTLTKGCCEFVKKGAFIQEMYIDEGYRAITIYVPDPYLQNLIREHRRFYHVKTTPNQHTEQIIELTVNETTARFIQTVLAFFSNAILPTETVLEERFQELVYALLTNPANHNLVTYLNSLTERPHVSLYEVMETNYMYNLSLCDYARIACRSLATFKREFATIFNTTPGRWLIQKRLSYAQTLLEITGKSIADIVFESGFENGSHFSRAFKEKYGIAPLHYRQQNQKNLTAIGGI